MRDVEALLRECEEEIGTRNIEYKLLGTAIFHRQVIGRDENHLFVVYEISTQDEIVLGSEAVALRRFSAEELQKMVANGSPELGAVYYFVAEQFYHQLLTVGCGSISNASPKL